MANEFTTEQIQEARIAHKYYVATCSRRVTDAELQESLLRQFNWVGTPERAERLLYVSTHWGCPNGAECCGGQFNRW